MSPAAAPSALESVLKRDRAIVLGSLAGATALAWTYLAVLATDMDTMPATMADAAASTRIRPWSAGEALLMFAMWVVMMIGMMVPSAAPMILLFARVSRTARERGGPFVPAGLFVLGYVLVWLAFSLAATALQWALEQAALLSPTMVSTSPLLGGGLLTSAGIYQWTRWKDACLSHCRSPAQFVMQHWRTGRRGALRMGLEHGAFCLGCCWVLMGLLFFGGVMNLLWIAVIALFVLLEKAAPAGRRVGRLSGGLLIPAGVFVLGGAVGSLP